MKIMNVTGVNSSVAGYRNQQTQNNRQAFGMVSLVKPTLNIEKILNNIYPLLTNEFFHGDDVSKILLSKAKNKIIYTDLLELPGGEDIAVRAGFNKIFTESTVTDQISVAALKATANVDEAIKILLGSIDTAVGKLLNIR